MARKFGPNFKWSPRPAMPRRPRGFTGKPAASMLRIGDLRFSSASFCCCRRQCLLISVKFWKRHFTSPLQTLWLLGNYYVWKVCSLSFLEFWPKPKLWCMNFFIKFCFMIYVKTPKSSASQTVHDFSVFFLCLNTSSFFMISNIEHRSLLINFTSLII